MNAREQIVNGTTWFRRNIALIVAFGSLLFSVVGWYSSYSVLCYRVDLNTQIINALRQDLRDLDVKFGNHVTNSDPHSNREWRDMVMKRLDSLDRKLDTIVISVRKQ